MRSCFITFRSVTLAQRGENALRRGGVDCVLQRTPRWMEEKGCGYCLRLHTREVESAVVLLREREIPFRKVYVQRDSGVIEEMRL